MKNTESEQYITGENQRCAFTKNLQASLIQKKKHCQVCFLCLSGFLYTPYFLLNNTTFIVHLSHILTSKIVFRCYATQNLF